MKNCHTCLQDLILSLVFDLQQGKLFSSCLYSKKWVRGCLILWNEENGLTLRNAESDLLLENEKCVITLGNGKLVRYYGIEEVVKH